MICQSSGPQLKSLLEPREPRSSCQCCSHKGTFPFPFFSFLLGRLSALEMLGKTPFTAPVQTWLSVLESTSLPAGEVAFLSVHVLSAVRISPALSQGCRAHYRILFNIIVAYIQNSFHEPNTVKAVAIMWIQEVTIYSQLVKLLSPSAFFQCELEFG